MDPRQVADFVREMARAQGDDLSEADIAEVVSAVGLPRDERNAIVNAWDGRMPVPESTERTKRLPPAIQVERVKWRGVPSGLVRERGRVMVAATAETTGMGLPFQRPDDQGAWASRIKIAIERRTQAKLAARAKRAPKPRKKREHWGLKGRTYHA